MNRSLGGLALCELAIGIAVLFGCRVNKSAVESEE